MSDAAEIMEKIKDEIESYSSSKAHGKSLIYEHSSAELMNKLETLMDSLLETRNLEKIELEDIVKMLFNSLGWSSYDN